jgi:hypothetical protein
VSQGKPQSDSTAVNTTLVSESYILAASYLTLSVVCWYFFYNDPGQIGITIVEDSALLQTYSQERGNYHLQSLSEPASW